MFEWSNRFWDIVLTPDVFKHPFVSRIYALSNALPLSIETVIHEEALLSIFIFRCHHLPGDLIWVVRARNNLFACSKQWIHPNEDRGRWEGKYTFCINNISMEITWAAVRPEAFPASFKNPSSPETFEQQCWRTVVDIISFLLKGTQ